MPSVEALKTLYALWKRYKSNQPFDRKSTPKLTAWRDVFDNLHDVRPWGPADRLPQEIVDAWQEDLEQAPKELHRIEIELWYRDNPKRQDAASKCVRAQVKALGGTVKDERVIDDICYHAILVELPAASLRQIMAEPVDGLSAVDEVMFLRTQTLVRIKIDFDDDDLLASTPIEAPPVEAEPIVAMFDGVPLVAHDLLRDRLRFDDPHNLAGRYGSVAEQQHGTAMASIILNGDCHAPTPIPHRLYVQPVTIPVGSYERFPPERLTVHAMKEAIERMLEGVFGPDGTQIAPASAPRVRVVNLSLGDEKRRFAGVVSPWGRLLDHLAYKYRLLFLVSAGNIPDAIDFDNVTSFSELEDSATDRRMDLVLAAVFAHRGHRALLSPAEAINVVTIGARHSDNVNAPTSGARGIDPYHASALANVSSALGTGANRCAKPELLVNGGRERLQMRSSRDPVRVVPMDQPGSHFGIRAARPSLRGSLDESRNVSGTSPATALATNSVLRIEEALRANSDFAVPEDMLAVVLKALLVHGATWDADVAAKLKKLAADNGCSEWSHQRVEISRFLGLGHPDIARVLANTHQRALALGWGSLEAGKAAPFHVLLPRTLSGRNEMRGLTATLAWLTPTHFRHSAYRHAVLDLNLRGLGKDGSHLGAEKVGAQPHDDLSDRGTVIHRRWAGSDPAIFIDKQGLEFRIGCRSPTKGLVGRVPYAIVVTLEVGVGSKIDVFTEVDVGIRTRVPIRIRPAVDNDGE